LLRPEEVWVCCYVFALLEAEPKSWSSGNLVKACTDGTEWDKVMANRARNPVIFRRWSDVLLRMLFSWFLV